jgi:hypothetical protein
VESIKVPLEVLLVLLVRMVNLVLKDLLVPTALLELMGHLGLQDNRVQPILQWMVKMGIKEILVHLVMLVPRVLKETQELLDNKAHRIYTLGMKEIRGIKVFLGFRVHKAYKEFKGFLGRMEQMEMMIFSGLKGTIHIFKMALGLETTTLPLLFKQDSMG